MNGLQITPDIRDAAERVFHRTHALLAPLLVVQFVLLVALAHWLSPLTWSGADSALHPHMIATLLLGGASTAFPLFLVRRAPDSALTRCAVGAAQMVHCSLAIHLTGGRLETHFYIFVSLAGLAAYRDWKVLITATVVAAGDHLFRGIYYPQSIFGFASGSVFRVFEHASYVVLEDVILLVTMRHSILAMKEFAQERAQNERLLAELSAQQAMTEQQVAEGVQRSQERVQGVVREFIGLNRDISSTTEGASSLVGQADETKQMASRSEEVLHQTMETVRSLEDAFAAVEEMRTRFEESTKGIASITELISGIAFQSNLLALNAAVEAARAGDHGQGFAVVAGEVRDLATRTAEAARKIQQLTGSIDSDSSAMGSCIGEARSSVGRSLDLANEADLALRAMREQTESTLAGIADFVQRSENHARHSQRISSMVEGIVVTSS